MVYQTSKLDLLEIEQLRGAINCFFKLTRFYLKKL
jgi:hypothetical protein